MSYVVSDIMSPHVITDFMSSHVITDFMSSHVITNFMSSHVVTDFMSSYVVTVYLGLSPSLTVRHGGLLQRPVVEALRKSMFCVDPVVCVSLSIMRYYMI